MKDLKKIKGATLISKKGQKNIKGGFHTLMCDINEDCYSRTGDSGVCIDGICWY